MTMIIPKRFALSPVERRHPRRGKAGIKRKRVDKRVRTRSRHNRIQKSVTLGLGGPGQRCGG